MGRIAGKPNPVTGVCCSQETKDLIVRLYVAEKRGKQHIAKVIGRSDVCIANWLKAWGIPSWGRKTIQKNAMAICGPTKGFSGRKHQERSKKKISKSGRKAWENEGRQAVSNHSLTYNTTIGRLLGKWEVAYAQSFASSGKDIPKRCRIRIRTPYGTYQPDFELDGEYIEIKSPFTLALGNGEFPEMKAKSNINQMKKLKYVSENIKRVRIVVLSPSQVKSLFAEAQQPNGILL